MGYVSGLVRAIYELLVDDGQLAIGVVAALGLAAVWTALASDPARDLGGPFLFVVLMALLLANLQRAARNARRASKG